MAKGREKEMIQNNLSLRIKPIRCLLFDLGYTLWDRRKHSHLWYRAEQEANQRALSVLRTYFGANRLPSGTDEVLGERLRELFDTHEHDLIRRFPGQEPDKIQIVLQVLPDLDIHDGTPELGAAVFEALNVRIPDSLPLLDDALPTLQLLRERGYLLGVVTNRLWGGKAFRDDLQTLGLLDLFSPDALAVSADLGIRKPNPAIFQYALSALGIRPEQAAMVGDSLRTDILGAQQLGIFTVWQPRPQQRLTIQRYEASQRDMENPEQAGSASPEELSLLQDSVTNTQEGFGADYLPANTQGRDGYLERYLRGEITPDLIIERPSDLLSTFVKAIEE